MKFFRLTWCLGPSFAASTYLTQSKISALISHTVFPRQRTRREVTVSSAALARLVCTVAILLFTIQGQTQQSLQVLHNHVRSVVSSGQAALMGPVPATQRMQLSIVLPLRNQAALTELLGQLYDPSSADFRHFLSVEQFTEQFGPTEEDYQTVDEFAKAKGFTVTGSPANRLIVPISGTAAQVERAFNVRMNNYQHPTEDRTFFSPDREPSLNLSVPVAHIAGLDNFSIPRPAVIRKSNEPVAAAVVGSAPGGGSYLGSDMRAAYYGGSDLTGSGQCVGLYELGGYDISDVNSTFSSAGQTYSVPVNNVLIDGGTGGSTGDDLEQVLDIVQAIGMAPGLSQVRVYIENEGPGSPTDVFNAMAAENICKQLSVSWAWSPGDIIATYDSIFQEFAAQGQSLFAASGDYGSAYNGAGNAFPAEDAYVTAVGGTDLLTNGAAGPWLSETAWNGSGGGPSPDGIAIPIWQAGLNGVNGTSTTLRNVPDVAMEANADYTYSCWSGTCGGVGGTSIATPLWAGFMALVNQQATDSGNPPVGFINPAIYAIGESSSYGSDFHDITSGNDLCCGNSIFYNAGTGYDLLTGWGSPNGENLINALAFANSMPTCGNPSQNSPYSGTYSVPPTKLPLVITWNNPTSACVLHYTTDGSAPTASSPTYPAGGLAIYSTTVIRVIAAETGYDNSAIIGGKWTLTARGKSQGLVRHK